MKRLSVRPDPKKIHGPPILACLTALILVAGCLQSTDEETPEVPAVLDPSMPTIRIPYVASVEESQGMRFMPQDLDLVGAAKVRIENGDTVRHHVIGVPPELDDTPQWVRELRGEDHGDHSEDDSHDGHDETGGHEDHGGAHDEHSQANGHSEHGGGSHHGGSAMILYDGPTVFDVSIEAGGFVDVDVPEDTTVEVICLTHPWMTSKWRILPANPVPYEVTAHTLTLAGEEFGEVRIGSKPSTSDAWEINAPDMIRLEAVLSWDDSLDDPLGIDETNHPDTLHLALVAPDGTVVAEDSQTAREGQLVVTFEPEAAAWPTAVEAPSFLLARQQLATEHPQDPTWSGEWQTVVTLVSSPDMVPDEDGSLQDAAMWDGKQRWSLTLEATHRWLEVGGQISEEIYEMHPVGSAAGHH